MNLVPVEAIDNAPANKDELIAMNNNLNNLRDNNQTSQILTRDMLAYHIYRDGVFLAEEVKYIFLYLDNDTEHDVIYCYTVKQYDMEIQLILINQRDQWVLLPPTNFYASGVNGQIEMVGTCKL